MLLISSLTSRVTYLEGLITYEIIIPDRTYEDFRNEPILQSTIPYWPVEEHENVKRRIHCESSGNARVSSPAGHKGLLQIDEFLFKLEFPHYAYLDLFDPNSNLLAGYLIWERYGWGMWECK